jgi:hypothetical protein
LAPSDPCDLDDRIYVRGRLNWLYWSHCLYLWYFWFYDFRRRFGLLVRRGSYRFWRTLRGLLGASEQLVGGNCANVSHFRLAGLYVLSH